jgi:SAM-dependent methyltransferase
MSLTDPLLEIDKRSKSAWNDAYVLEVSKVLWSDAAVPHVMRLAQFAEKSGARTALDLPCGDGRNLQPLAAAVPIVVGADSSGNALDIAADLARLYGLKNCLLLRADIFDTGFVGGQFDFVLCWDLLGHLRNIVPAISELLRITHLGGHVVGSAFALGDSTRGVDMNEVAPSEYLYRDRFYYRFYSREEIEAMLAAMDAELVSLELAVWREPPHEGFREYEHEHQSWVFILKKRESHAGTATGV